MIPLRSNFRSLSGSGGPARDRVVRRIKKIGLEAWKKEVQYGKRWRAEIFSSALKRAVGEVIMAIKLVYQILEAIMAIYAYFQMGENRIVN